MRRVKSRIENRPIKKSTRNSKLKSSSEISISYGFSKTKSSYLSQFITKNAYKNKSIKTSRKKKDSGKSMNFITQPSKINFSLNNGKIDMKLQKFSEKVFASPTKGRHRRTRSTITPEMLGNCPIPHLNHEEKAPKEPPQEFSKQKKRKANKTNIVTFSPILEEENYDNVIVKTCEEDEKGEINGPSYIDAIKFASVYNTQADFQGSQALDDQMIKAKMNKINEYRDRLRRKSEILSRNVKKEERYNVKNTSSKAESGIAGSSTRESQN